MFDARPTNKTPIETDQALSILALRLLVARAAQADSLRWWDDEVLTEPAAFILDRTFPHSPPLAARSLALQAALARHRDAAEVFHSTLHLYQLDWHNGDILALRALSLMAAAFDPRPIPDRDEYRRRLLGLTSRPATYEVTRQATNSGFVVRIPPAPPGVHLWLHRAAALAWAYLEGEAGRAAIPLIVE